MGPGAKARAAQGGISPALNGEFENESVQGSFRWRAGPKSTSSGALPMTDTPPPFVLWRPGNIINRVSCEPRLASWNKKSHPDQIRLAAYLDEVTAGLGRLPDALLYLEVIVRVRKAEHLLRHHDLENYLQPLIDRLGQQRFCYATARKQLNQPSEVRIGHAELLADPLPATWEHFECRTPSGVQYKETLRNRLAACASLMPEGPLSVHLAWRCSETRNWSWLWKPTADSMGPVLGEPNPNPFHPSDDRITELHLHLTRDANIGHAVDVGMWWKAGDRDDLGKVSSVERDRTREVPLTPSRSTADVGKFSQNAQLFPDRFWIYEDDPTDKAQVHRSQCRFCNDGLGLHRRIDRKSDNRWLGPFSDVETALVRAGQTGRKHIKRCGVCRP